MYVRIPYANVKSIYQAGVATLLRDMELEKESQVVVEMLYCMRRITTGEPAFLEAGDTGSPQAAAQAGGALSLADLSNSQSVTNHDGPGDEASASDTNEKKVFDSPP